MSPIVLYPQIPKHFMFRIIRVRYLQIGGSPAVAKLQLPACPIQGVIVCHMSDAFCGFPH